MNVAKPITIVGGGLAGLTLGIGLRQRGIPVTIIEAGHYPRHRVCGEFISGKGQDVLARLGLHDALIAAGATWVRTTMFFLDGAASAARPLPRPALSLSRFVLDALLAREFRQLGGELREGERWRQAVFGEGIIRASGRRLQTRAGRWRWLGLKAHARAAPLGADLEMYASRDGYVGVSCVNDGEINVCGLFRQSARERGSLRPWQEMLRGAEGSPRLGRLANAIFEETSFCSTAGLSLKAHRATDRTECCIGDALTMIPPVTGNGMSMAFESAEIALEPLAAYSRGEILWPQAQRTVARACDRAFARRLAWARALQWMMFTIPVSRRTSKLLLASDLVWRWMFARTR